MLKKNIRLVNRSWGMSLVYSEQKCIFIPVHLIFLFLRLSGVVQFTNFNWLFKKIKSFLAVLGVKLAKGRRTLCLNNRSPARCLRLYMKCETPHGNITQSVPAKLAALLNAALKHKWNAKQIKTACLSIDYICQCAWNNMVLFYRQLRFYDGYLRPAMLWMHKNSTPSPDCFCASNNIVDALTFPAILQLEHRQKKYRSQFQEHT